MQHRFNLQDIAHHLGVATHTQRDYAEKINNHQLSKQFERQADEASQMADVFVELDNSVDNRRVYLDGDQLVVEVA